MTNETLGRGKSSLFKMVFSRTMVTMLFIFLQFLLFVMIFGYLQSYVYNITGSMMIIGAVFVIYILNADMTTEYKLSWILMIAVLPLFGILLFLYTRLDIGYRRLKKRVTGMEQSTMHMITSSADDLRALKQEDPYTGSLAAYLEESCGFPVYRNTKTQFFPLGELKFRRMLEELEQAEHFIFLEYYIVERGVVWNAILDILERKAAAGVEVRFMYDGMCSLSKLPYGYPEQIRSKHIRCKMFSPVRPMLSTDQNNRDHRKILVIDGKVAFTGGVNLADEYMNQKVIFGHWKDTAILIEGEAVQSFTLMFLQMWNAADGSNEDFSPYLKLYPVKSEGGYVIPYADGPTNGIDTAKHVYMDLIATAVSYIHIMTPYLILDDDFIVALVHASERGVDVRILIPGIPDKKSAYRIAHTYLPQLIKGGVKVYHYTPGFVHAKIMVSDDRRATVGTINLDYRSLYLNFECGVFLYKDLSIIEIERDFMDTIQKSKEITMKEYQAIPLIHRLAGRVFRLFGPMM